MKHRYQIPKLVLVVVILLSLAPIFVGLVNALAKASPNNLVLDLAFKPVFYTTIWTVAGIVAALFTGVMAFIDYNIRRESPISMFGIILLVSAILDVLYLVLIAKTGAAVDESRVYLLWSINRVFYTLAILLGSLYLLSVRLKSLRSPGNRESIIFRLGILEIILAMICITPLLFVKNFGHLPIQLGQNITLDLGAFLPLIIIVAWGLFVLPRFMLRFYSIFSKLLLLSILPLVLAQLFMSLSTQLYDNYFNAAHYLRFLAYLVPVGGIVLNYIETVKNEQATLVRLDMEVRQKKELTLSLQERENLLANAEEISKLGSWELDISANAYKWSDQLYKIYGFTDCSFRPTHAILEQLIAPAYTEKLNKELRQAVKNKGMFALEYEIVRHDGRRRFVLGQGYYSVKDNKLVGTVQDITELKEATLKMQKNETLLREGEALSHNGSWEWLGNRKHLHWSDEMFNIHGMLPHTYQITLSNYLSFIHPDDVLKVKRKFAKARKEKTSFFVDYRIIRPNDELRYVITTAKYKEQTVGDDLGFLGNTQDVTELHEAERQLQEKINELNMSNRELEQFAYVASHDLQEPLRKIRAFGERLSTKYAPQLDQEGQDYISRMQNAAERMQALIDDLLAFSRATRDTTSFSPIQLGNLINKVVSELDFSIEASAAQINIEVDVEVEGISSQLAQVFQNLLSNALKFVKPDVPPQIAISSVIVPGSSLSFPHVVPDQTYAVVTIKDNGIGFDEEYAEKIFDMFQRLHSRNEYKGTGIGLAIVKKIVEHHNGSISASSQLGQGATFNVILPIKHQ